ncbi:MAG: BspA family leucine-rich repeat surface protein, partial [Bacteroidetes bacterium]|nr:BspA family leucine-rich repeat surface protein [Bacteroidota bacterium]
MKKIILFLSLFLVFTSVNAQSFITTWKTDNPGTSNATSITIPTTGGGYNYDVDWDNDGIFDEFGFMGNVTHDFTIAGTYTIRIQGTFPRIYFNDGGDKSKILSVDQWGTIAWNSMNASFFGCNNLVINAADTPNLSSVMDMNNMFMDASSLGGGVGNWNWNTSNVNSMGFLFQNATSFNQDISSWNVSNVGGMESMFFGATSFNQ